MRCEKSLFFSVVFVCVALLATFAQGQSTPKARLTIRQMAKRAPQQAIAAAPLAAASTPGLPTWRFSVHSDRDGNNYTGVMVGKNPFSEDSGRTSVATQIIPILFKTSLNFHDLPPTVLLAPLLDFINCVRKPADVGCVDHCGCPYLATARLVVAGFRSEALPRGKLLFLLARK